jgi:hypothetical protein
MPSLELLQILISAKELIEGDEQVKTAVDYRKTRQGGGKDRMNRHKEDLQ